MSLVQIKMQLQQKKADYNDALNMRGLFDGMSPAKCAEIAHNLYESIRDDESRIEEIEKLDTAAI